MKGKVVQLSGLRKLMDDVTGEAQRMRGRGRRVGSEDWGIPPCMVLLLLLLLLIIIVVVVVVVVVLVVVVDGRR